MKSKLVVVGAILTLMILWWQAQQPAWNSHMQVDIWVMWERLSYWFAHNHSFAGLTGNEILPATLTYLFVPVWLSPAAATNYGNYLPMMMLVNLAILIGHYVIVKQKTILVLSLLFLGPILLFRFDGLVTLFLLLAFLFFEKGGYKMSGWWLGLATGMKVFPVIFLPYLCLILWKQNKIRDMLGLLIFFGEALLLPLLIFLLLGGSLAQVSSALGFHSQKLISIESVPGSLITGWSLLTNGHPPELIPGNGIWAVAGPATFFNKLWMIPIALTYGFVYIRKGLTHKFNWLVPFGFMLIFLVVSKNLNPQYLWWFMALLPFVKPSPVMMGLILVAALLNQLVFPLYYTTFVEDFYRLNQSYWVYYLLILRNVCLLAITYLSVKRLTNE